MVQSEMKNLVGAMIILLVGLFLTPVVFSAVNDINWTIGTGTSTIDLGFISYIVALIWAIGVGFLSFKIWSK